MLPAILQALETAAIAAALAAVPVLVPAITTYLRNLAGMHQAAAKDSIAARLDDGVIGLIRAALTELQAHQEPGNIAPETIVSKTAPKVQRNFPTTLAQLQLNEEAVKDYVRARIKRANGYDRDRHH